MSGEMQLNPCGWFIEEERKTEALLNHMKHVMGTFQTDSNVTYHFFEGYKYGIKAMYRKFEDAPIIKPVSKE